MFGVIAIIGVLVIVELLVWWQIRSAAIPPNARLTLDLWASLDPESGSGKSLDEFLIIETDSKNS